MRDDPGPCPICGAAHTMCTASSGPIQVPQTPARDALARATVAELEPPALTGAVPATAIGDGSDARPFTTGTYRGPRGRRR